MDSPTAASTTLPPRPVVWWRALLLIGLVGYAFFLIRHVGALAGASDSSGYLNNARLLAAGQTATPQRIPPGIDAVQFDSFTFIPLGFRPMPDATMAPTYPIGLPLVLLAAAKIAGWELAPPLVMMVSALLAVALMFPLGRAAGLTPGWAAGGALLFATCPLTTFMSVQLMSDIPATTVALVAIGCAWRSRTRQRWALAAGACLALGGLIRPTNFMLILPIAVCLGLNGRRWLLLGLGGFPGVLVQLIYNSAAYGNLFVSGYGDDLGSKFSFKIVPATLIHYARWLPVLLTPVGILALVLPWVGRRTRFAWVLVAWTVPFLAFYAGYWHTHEWWWYLRFLLPAFPAIIIGGLWVLRELWVRHLGPLMPSPLVARSCGIAAIIVILIHAAFWHHRLNAHLIGFGESIYSESSTWARENLPADAIILTEQTSGALTYYTDFSLVRWDSLNPEKFARLTAVVGKRPLVAALFPHEVQPALAPRLPGRWQEIGAVRHVTFWQWSPEG